MQTRRIAPNLTAIKCPESHVEVNPTSSLVSEVQNGNY